MADGMARVQGRKWQITINNPLDHGFDHEKIKAALHQFKGLLYFCLCDEEGDECKTRHIMPGTSTETFTTDTDSGKITVNVTVPSADSVPASLEPSSEVSPAYATRTLDDTAAPADSETMPGLITALFGSYTPRTQTVTEYLPDGSSVTYSEVVPGLAGLDWPWIASVALFAMSLYCVFRMIGGLFKWT